MRHVLADEIGLEFAAAGDWRLKATQTPVYGRAAAGLVPRAVSGGLTGFRVGDDRHVEGRELADKVGGPLTSLLQPLLAIRNHRFAGGDDLDLFIDLDPRLLARPGLIARAVASLDEVDLAAHRIVAFLDAGVPPTPAQRRAISVMVEAGVRIGLRKVLASPDFRDAALKLAPNCVRLDPGAIRSLRHSPQGARLLASFVAMCHDDGWTVAASALATGDELRLAHEVGCDFFQGDVLAATTLTGTDIDMEPRDVLSFGGPNVVPFPASRRSSA